MDRKNKFIVILEINKKKYNLHISPSYENGEYDFMIYVENDALTDFSLNTINIRNNINTELYNDLVMFINVYYRHKYYTFNLYIEKKQHIILPTMKIEHIADCANALTTQVRRTMRSSD